MTDAARYWSSVFAVGVLFGAGNLFLLWQEGGCADCMHTYGFPLPAFMEGGFVTIRKFFWGGLAIDLMTLLAFSAIVSWTWKRLLQGPAKPKAD